MSDLLSSLYPWIKSLHVISVIAWMAGIFYLPRLFVYHVENGPPGSDQDKMFQTMERRLLRAIMNPAMLGTWIFGLCLVFTPGIVSWEDLWPWIKASMVLAMTWYHHWLGKQRKGFVSGTNAVTSKTYRLMNEVPTILMVIIVVSVIARPFS